MVDGAKIARLRKDHGFLIEELGERVGVSRATMGFYEQELQIPNALTLERIAHVLEVPIGELFRDDNAPGDPGQKRMINRWARKKAEDA
jgi:transcriptional regulator with XRE-family HTH domain